MRELRLLWRLERQNLLRINEIRHTKDKKQRRRLLGMLAGYALAALVGLLYTGLMFYGLYAAGLGAGLPGVGVLLTAMLTLLIVAARAQGTLFRFDDGDRLGSLPFTQGQVVLSKLLGLYFAALLGSVAVMVPASVFYLLAQGFSVPALLRLVLITVLSPLAPMVLGLLAAAIAAALTGIFRHRHLMGAILLMLMLSLVMVFIYTAPMGNMDEQQLITAASGITGRMTAGWPPTAFAQRAADGSVKDLALFALMGLVPMLGAAWLLIGRYGALRQFFTSRNKARAKAGHTAPRRPVIALAVKEVRRVISSPLYLFNTVMMAWMPPVALLFVTVLKPQLLLDLRQSPQFSAFIAPFTPLAAALFAVASNTSALSLSMEGKNAWLMATCPVPAKTVYLSKGLPSYWLCAPAALLTTLALWVLLRLDVLTAISSAVFGQTLCALGAVLGLMIDRRFARYNWDSEHQIVKNSMQTFLLMTAQFGALLVFGLLSWVFSPLQSLTGLALALPAGALCLLLWRHVSKRPIFVIP